MKLIREPLAGAGIANGAIISIGIWAAIIITAAAVFW
jgi:hypothetical protein